MLKKLIVLIIYLMIFNIYSINKSDEDIRYVNSINGLNLRLQPILTSKKIRTLRLGEKLIIANKDNQLTEIKLNNIFIKNYWYEVIVESTREHGWVFGEFISDEEGVLITLKNKILPYKKYCLEETLFNLENEKILSIWNFPGGEMIPSQMFFISNGLMIVNSGIFAKEDIALFKYKYHKETEIIEVFFIDNRLSYEKYTKHEVKSSLYNKENKSIEYKLIKSNAGKYPNGDKINFFGWYFFGENNFE